MPITIPDRTKLRLTNGSSVEGNQPINAVAKTSFLRCGPVCVDAASPHSPSGAPLVIFANGNTGALGYLGFNIEDGISQGRGVPVQRGVIVEGFAGCTPGGAVFIDSTALPGGFATSATSADTFSGLTHTQPVSGVGVSQRQIGVALSTTRIRFE